MKLKTRIFRPIALLVVLAAALPVVAVESAADILSAMTRKMASAPAVEATFTVTGADRPVEGSIIMAGAKFAMTTPVLSVWYDGVDQWTMLESSGEVNITNPTRDELMQCNPFAVISSYAGHYTVRRLADSNGRRRVELTPSTPSDLAKVVIMVGADNWPAAVSLVFDDGRSIAATVNTISSTRGKPMSAFRFDPQRYPAVAIVDLR